MSEHKITVPDTDQDIEIVLPTGGQILLQYRAETGLVDICFVDADGNPRPEALTVVKPDCTEIWSGLGPQIICGVNRNESERS